VCRRANVSLASNLFGWISSKVLQMRANLSFIPLNPVSFQLSLSECELIGRKLIDRTARQAAINDAESQAITQ